FEKEFTQHIGLELNQIERLTLLLPEQSRQQPLTTLTTSRAADPEKVARALLKEYEEKKIGDRVLYVMKRKGGRAICFVTDRLLLLGETQAVEKVLARKPSKEQGALTAALNAAGKPLGAAAFNIAALLVQEVGENLRGEFAALKPCFAARPGMLTAMGN